MESITSSSQSGQLETPISAMKITVFFVVVDDDELSEIDNWKVAQKKQIVDDQIRGDLRIETK